MRAWLLVIVCGVAMSCSGSSTAADAPVLPLRPGLQLLTLTGYVASADPAFTPCVPAGVPRDGTSVNTVVLLTAEGDGWTARSSGVAGSLELRLRGTGTTASAYTVAGSLRGSAPDIGLNGVVRDVSVTMGSGTGANGDTALLDGSTTSLSSTMVVGRVSGTTRFSDSAGRSSDCSAIAWTMQPY